MNTCHFSKVKKRGFVAWCLVLAMSIVVMCLGIYTSTITQEYRDAAQFLETKARVQRDIDSCRVVLLRMLAARSYIDVGVQTTPVCAVVATSTKSVSFLVYSKLYSLMNTLRYSVDGKSGQVSVL